MRLIIDISKNEYNDIIEQVKNCDYPDMGLGKIIANGKPYEERPQGEWIEEIVPVGLVGRGNGQYRCSNCQHGDVHAKTQEVPFCWYCGAKMDGGEEE